MLVTTKKKEDKSENNSVNKRKVMHTKITSFAGGEVYKIKRNQNVNLKTTIIIMLQSVIV